MHLTDREEHMHLQFKALYYSIKDTGIDPFSLIKLEDSKHFYCSKCEIYTYPNYQECTMCRSFYDTKSEFNTVW